MYCIFDTVHSLSGTQGIRSELLRNFWVMWSTERTEFIHYIVTLLNRQDDTRPADHVFAHVDLIIEHSFLNLKNFINF